VEPSLIRSEENAISIGSRANETARGISLTAVASQRGNKSSPRYKECRSGQRHIALEIMEERQATKAVSDNV